jgi:hypothetical protein
MKKEQQKLLSFNKNAGKRVSKMVLPEKCATTKGHSVACAVVPALRIEDLVYICTSDLSPKLLNGF